MSAPDPERIPVIVGVGQVNDRPDDPTRGQDPGELMAAALRAADEDAGGGWLADCQSLALVGQISFPGLDPLVERVARETGMTPAIGYQTEQPSGDSPIRLLHEAANRIGAGEVRIAAVSGGEALRTAAARARALATEANALRAAAARRPAGYRQAYGLATPVDVYPLYENACRAAWGQTLAEAQAESAEIWARFSQVAAANPAAWIHQPRTAEEIATPGADNRPIAHPYTKLMVANASVNQGAGFIVASLAEACRRGVAEERITYVGMGAAAHEAEDFLARASYDASPGMAVSIERAMELNGLDTDDLDHVELYSCFPCVPKLARRVLGWPVERAASVFGGLTFGGGPIGNYMSHAVASMVDALRAGGGTGLLFANGGYATHNHTIALSSRPFESARFPQEFDFQAEADAARGAVPPLDKHYAGPAAIETYTVFYARDGSARRGVVVARTPEGSRTLAQVPGEDAQTITFLTDGAQEPVGSAGIIERGGGGTLARWRMG